MRIQEMRSGLPHLRKKLAVGNQNNFFAETLAKEAFIESLIEFIESDEPEVAVCEIDQPMWSVVSFDRREAGGLSYGQASVLISELDSDGVTGLCIIADDAAARIVSSNVKT